MAQTTAKLALSCTVGTNPRSQAIIDGEVRPEGIDLTITPLQASEQFYRQLKFAEFDVSEMSMASLTIATSEAPTNWVAIPIFTTRRFFHVGILVRRDRGIRSPADLTGKRLGVPEFQQTAAVWKRAVLRSEFGWDPRSAKWFMERTPDISHGGQMGFAPPAGIDLQYIPKETNIGEMLVSGDLDAAFGWIPYQNMVDRSTVDPRKDPNVGWLFDQRAEPKRYYAKTGIYPISHCVVIRRSIVEQHPWVVMSIYNMFEAVRKRNAAQIVGNLWPYYETGLLDPAYETVLTGELMANGLKSSRKVLEIITQGVYDDGLTKRRVPLEDIFAPETLDL